jgi:hypothetical protein
MLISLYIHFVNSGYQKDYFGYHCLNLNLSLHINWLPAGRLRGRILGPSGDKNFLFSRVGLGPTKSPMGTGATSPGVKQPESKTKHSLLTSAKVKKTLIYTCIPPYVFMAQ